jgi:hypothetical protein
VNQAHGKRPRKPPPWASGDKGYSCRRNQIASHQSPQTVPTDCQSYEKRGVNYLAMVIIAAILLWL